MTNVRFYFRHKERQRGKHFCFHTLSFRLCNAHKLYFNVVFELFPCGISFMPGRFTNAASPAAHRSTTGPEIRWIRMAGRSFCGRRRHGGRRGRIPQGAEPRRPCGRGGAGGFARVFGRGMQKGRSRAAPPFFTHRFPCPLPLTKYPRGCQEYPAG